MRNPPQPPPRFADITPSTLVAEVESVLQSFSALQDRLVTTITPSTATFRNLVRPLLDEINHVKYRTNVLVLLSRASPDAQIRQAARDADQHVREAQDRCWLRRDLAALVSAVSPTPELDDEDTAVLDHVRGLFARSGASLQDDAARARIEQAQAEIRALDAAAVKCFTESGADEGMWFTRAELDGCPESWIATLKQEGVRFFVPHRGESHMNVLRSARNEDTRRALFLARQRLYPENVERLARVVSLRDEVARLLGFENHASLKMQETMMKSVDGLRERMATLQAKLKPLAGSDIARLVELKRAERAEQKSSLNDPTFYTWDRLYYTNLQMKTDYAIDQAKVSEYFEVSHVLLEMLKIFEDLFGMVFVPMHELDTWHGTVSPFGVWNADVEGGDFLGYLYIDIFERPGKFSNQYHSRIQPGYFDASGKRHFPVSALFCSYPGSTPERPSLLPHRDVRIMFHELGHAIHHLVERTKYGLGQSRDFGEIPSKMLEHFVWLPEVLVRLSKHVSSLPGFASAAESRDGERVPLELARALQRSQTLNLAIGLLNLMQGAVFDLALYSPKNHNEASAMDTTAIWNQTRRQLPFKDGNAEGEGLFGQASFSLAFRGYDANYFTYVMSEVYAADLFETAFARDPLSPEAGRKWRHQVLERGSSQPELEMLERFLGRPLHLDGIIEQIARGQKM